MATIRNVDRIGDVAAAVVQGDDQIRDRVRGLVNALLADAEYTIKFGSASERAQLMRMIVPPLLKSLQSADVNSGEEARAQAYERMMKALAGVDSA